jgi:methyl-accepting chemotaxis protein
MINFEKTDELFKDRLDFIDLDKQARTLLQELQPFLVKSLGPALDSMLAKLSTFPDFYALKDSALAAASKGRLNQTWSNILSGEFDAHYTEAVRATGQHYARNGLKPRWLMGPYGLVLEHFIHAIVTDQWPRLLRKSKVDANGLANGLSALVKAILLDLDVSISVYLEIVEGERKRAEEARQNIEHNQMAALKMVADALDRLAAGDLATGMAGDPAEEFKKLKSDFNRAIGELRETIGSVSRSTGSITSGIGEISQAADDLSRRTEQQAAGLEETAAALEQITATIQKAAQGTAHARDVVASAQADAERGGQVVRNAIDAMSEIEKSSQQIGQIIGVIDEIAFQTNLLALNAGVEAARAGEAGRGFAVVASEVRALAQRSAEAAKEIKALISASGQHVGQGVDLVGETGKALDRIDAQVKELAKIITEITAGTQEQATGLKEVNTAVNQMDQATQQNAAMVEETTAACHALAQETDELSRLVSRFETGQNTVVAPLRRGSQKTLPPTVRPARPHHIARGDTNLLRKPKAAAAEDSWEEF